MAKSLYIAEKPSVAQELVNALEINARRSDGYIESENAIAIWCVGHLVIMSYPEAYDAKLKRWSLETLSFPPKEFKYQVIERAARQFKIVSGFLNREDVDIIYIYTDSGCKGEYIYHLVDQMAGVRGKIRRRVWIDSQTEEEILRGVREAEDWSEYGNLSSSAYLRAKEDYPMGINFSRFLTLKYRQTISNYLRMDHTILSAGRVMTCVSGMVARQEWEIRNFVKTPFYRVIGSSESSGMSSDGEWWSVSGSKYFETPYPYKENGLKACKTTQELIDMFSQVQPPIAQVAAIEKKKGTKNPPFPYNLVEIRNDCSKVFKISPDETLWMVQELYEKKLVTYPRTGARVLSTAVAKEIHKNIGGLRNFAPVKDFASEVLESGFYKRIAKTRYVNDKQVTDHHAIILTGQGFGALRSLSGLSEKAYRLICRRFLSVFYPAAIYQKYGLELAMEKEHFFANFWVMLEPGYLKVADVFFGKEAEAEQKRQDVLNKNAGDDGDDGKDGGEKDDAESAADSSNVNNPEFIAMPGAPKKGAEFNAKDLIIKEGETSLPKRYTSGSMILAMENAGQLIEDEELRVQIKGNGIGTSAARAEILKKLVSIKYLSLNGKIQVITSSLLGETIFDVVDNSTRQLLSPDSTVSWEKGLTYVAKGSIIEDEYMEKLEKSAAGRIYSVLKLNNQYRMREYLDTVAANYKKGK